VVQEAAGLDAGGLKRRIEAADFSNVGVEPIEPSIEDVFVHLVSTQREEGDR
jgi:hypothetical protein